MRFWQGMVFGIAVGLTGLALYNRTSNSTKAMLRRRAQEATELIGSAAKAMRVGPMVNTNNNR
ncbi:MAG: hypothetical protein PHD88_05565 [Firmicutes bacterium]|nr:hypothetical protein [Bacillota bacterium]MDD4262972.1 hypothetical protein [Bacillota bacterium]MDD4693846.1 hypothetical protein [Bacillota bacterium]